MHSATASTPGGIGNLGPGLDVLGCAIAGARDIVNATWHDRPGITILDAGHADLPTHSSRHSSALAAAAVLNCALRKGITFDAAGIALAVQKGLPLSGGQGGSAASAVAGAVAVDALLGAHLESQALLECCLVAEAKVSGRHLDNIAPQLLGGIVLIRSIDPVDVVKLPVPHGLHIVIAQPSQKLSTSRARRALPPTVPLAIAVHQMAQTAAIVAACFRNDLALFGRAIDDRIAEPVRAPLIPGFIEAKAAALGAGALGTSISGAGPAIFAVCDSKESGTAIYQAMCESYAKLEIECHGFVTTVDEQGTTVVVE